METTAAADRIAAVRRGQLVRRRASAPAETAIAGTKNGAGAQTGRSIGSAAMGSSVRAAGRALERLDEKLVAEQELHAQHVARILLLSGQSHHYEYGHLYFVRTKNVYLQKWETF